MAAGFTAWFHRGLRVVGALEFIEGNLGGTAAARAAVSSSPGKDLHACIEI